MPELDFPFYPKKNVMLVAVTDQQTNKHATHSYETWPFNLVSFCVSLCRVISHFFAIHKGYLKHFQIFISIAIFCRPAGLMPSRANPTSRTDFPANGMLFKFELNFNQRYTSIDHHHPDLLKPHPS